MIRKACATAALPIADALVEQNRVLVPVADSTMSELVKWTYGVAKDSLTVSKEENVIDLITEQTGTAVLEGMSGHGAVVDQEAANVVAIISQQLKYVKTKAKPLLDNTFAEMVADRNAVDLVTVDVVEFGLADLYRTDAFASLMSVYGDLDRKGIKSVQLRDFPERTEQELLDYISVGAVTFDQMVQEIVSGKHAGWLIEVYERHFRDSHGWEYTHWDSDKQIHYMLYQPLQDLTDEYLMVFLLAQGLKDEPHKGFKGPLSLYREHLAAKCRASAVAMTLALGEFIQAEKSGSLVIRYDTAKSQQWQVRAGVVVNRTVYQRYLEQGGVPEAVMGAALLQQFKPRSLKEFLDRQVECASEYARRVKRAAAAREANTVEDTRARVRYWFYNLVVNGDKLDIPNLVHYDESNREDWVASVDRCIDEIVPRRFADDLYLVLRELMGRLLWAGTNIIELLTTIDEEMQKHSELDPREAAYRATMRILARHYLKQIQYKHVDV